MKLKESLVSVILPVYNAGKFLPFCLESIRKQTYTDFEIIAIDDHSSDNSFKILNQFKKKDKRIKLSRNKKKYGLAICYNRALKIAKGQFVAFINPNDITGLERLKRQVKFLVANPKTVAVGTQYTTIDENNKKLTRSNFPQEHEVIYNAILPATSLKPESVMINRHLLPKDILHFTHNKYPFIFTEIFIKMLQYGKFANLNQWLYSQRVGIKRGRKHSKVTQIISLAKLWVKSRATYDYHPPIKSFLPPMVKEI